MAKSSFLEILQTLTGRGSDNRLIGEYEDAKSPTGKGYIDNTKGLIESFEYADKDRQKRVGEMQQSGGYYNLLGLKIPNWPGSNTANTPDDMGENRVEYVPFAYTNTSDINEPLKYGYIMRYGHDPATGWTGYGPNKIYGVTTEMKDYTAEGAKKFFDNIKNNGGVVRLYTKPLEEMDINKNTKSLQMLSDVDKPTEKTTRQETFYGGHTGEGGSGAYGTYSLIEAMREANRLNKNNGR